MRRLIVDNLLPTQHAIYGNARCDFIGLVYKLVNRITGDIYIGQTTQSLQERFRRHCIQEDSTMFPIIAQYGSANFDIEILSVCFAPMELTKQEYEFIEQYSITHKLYNIQKTERKEESTKIKLQLVRSGTRVVDNVIPMKTLRKTDTLRGVDKEKPVIGTHLDTGETLELKSMSCDSRFDPRLISACCRGKRRSHRRYAWSYKNA